MSDTLAALSDQLSGLVAEAAPSVVGVHSHRSRSSGIAVGADLIVTAEEALAEEGEIAVSLPGGERRPATLVGRDPSTDVALLRVEGGALPALTLNAAALPRAGALALALGSAEGHPLAAFGVVAHSGPAWRSLRGGEIDARIELDLRLARHAEGGLVIDVGGQALGMAVFGPRRRALVIPGATILRAAGELEKHGKPRRGYLGLGLQPVRLDGDEGWGLMAISVDANGPAASAGLAQGDVLTGWDGRPIPPLREVQRALGAASVGRTARVSYRRGGQTHEAQLTVGERPAA
ncbi:MAG TPA: S1C family serine protease [Mesorhizobium sp.]|jgi:S1-C subfamily serine protease|nr:S1C family serine protease [Mesorhizobium sp.]